MKFSKKIVALVLFLIFSIFGSLDIDASGETMDEWYHYFVSRKVVSAILHLDFSEASHGYRTDQPPMYKYIYGLPALLTQKFAPENPSYSQFNLTFTRITSVVATALTAVVILLFGWEFFSPKVGLLSSIIFFTLPYTLAYARVVSSDTPGTLFFSLTVYLFVKALTLSGNNKYYIYSTLALAGSLLSKYNNALILLLLFVMLLIYKYKEFREKRSIEVPLYLFFMVPTALVLFYLGWPWIWEDSLTRFTQSLTHWVKQSRGYSSLNLQYFPVYFAVTTPTLVLLGLVFFLISLVKNRSKINLVLLLWFLIPFGVSVSKYKIDGVRFITAAFVPLSLACALGYDQLTKKITPYLEKIPKTHKLPSFWPALVLPLILIIYQMVNVVLYHPYYLDYFNELVGGPKNASERFSVGYWGEGVKEAVDYVNKNAPNEATVRFAVSQPNFIPKLRKDLKVLKPIIPDTAKTYTSSEDYVKDPLTTEKTMYIVQYELKLEGIEEAYDEVYAAKVRDHKLARVYKLKQ